MSLIKFPGKDMSPRLADARHNSMDIPELIGLCKGVLADGTINLAEAEFIHGWLSSHSNVMEFWPADELSILLAKVLEDDKLTQREEEELADLLEEITGEPTSVLFY